MTQTRDLRRHTPALVAVTLLVLAAAVLTLAVLCRPLLAPLAQRARLEASVEGLGPLGPLAIILLQMAQVLVAPVPGQAIGLASGYLFGPWLGALYSMTGLLLGSLLAVTMVRRWGRPLVERLVNPSWLARIDRLAGDLGIPLLFLVFLVPFLPDDTILLIAGLAGIPLPGIMLAALLGRLPGVLALAFIGASATSITRPQAMAVATAAILVAAPLYCYRARVERLGWSLIGRVTGRSSSGSRGYT